jgi:hypothetical protein
LEQKCQSLDDFIAGLMIVMVIIAIAAQQIWPIILFLAILISFLIYEKILSSQKKELELSTSLAGHLLQVVGCILHGVSGVVYFTNGIVHVIGGLLDLLGGLLHICTTGDQHHTHCQ